MKAYKVIFHITELEKWDALLANVSNLLKEMSDVQLEIEVLANGNAVHYYDSTNEVETNLNKMKSLSDSDVRIVGCSNSLTNNGITKDKLYPFVEVVPAGVGELVRKQNEGYAYIRI